MYAMWPVDASLGAEADVIPTTVLKQDSAASVV